MRKSGEFHGLFPDNASREANPTDFAYNGDGYRLSFPILPAGYFASASVALTH